MKYDLIIEKLSGHDKSGKVGKINKKAGAVINSGDIIFTIESGKGNINYISKYKGILEQLLVSEGDIVNKDQVVGKVEGESVQTTYSFGINKPLLKNYEIDIVIVGGGPGGYVSAIRAAQGGKKFL